MDISNATDHTCIDCEKLDAVARYNDVLIVITNDSCLFEHTYRNDSLTLKYPKFQFCDFDEDYVMLHKGDTIVFLNNEDQTLSLIEASISSDDFSIGGLFVGMDEFELSKLLGFKTSCLRDINKVIILPNFYYTMAQNQIRHPRIPQYPPFYDRIILTYDNHIKDIKVTMVSCQENLLLGPDFVSSDVANDSSSMEDYDE